MALHPVKSPLHGPAERRRRVGVLLQILLGGKVGGIGYFSALLADRKENISLPGHLHLRGGGFKQGHVVPLAAGKCPGHHVELHAGVHVGIHSRHDAVLLHHVFQRHFRHTALAPADNVLAAQIVPGEVPVFPSHEERAVALGQLSDDHRAVLFPLLINIHAALRPCQAYVTLPGHHGGHDLIRSAAVGQLDGQSLFFKKAQFQCRILWRIEHGVGHLIESDGDGLPFFLTTAAQKCPHKGHSTQNCSKFFHVETPNKSFSRFSAHSTPRYIATAATASRRTLVITRSMLNTWDP